MKGEARIVPVVDLGATNTRRGFVIVRAGRSRFIGKTYLLFPRKPKKIKNPTKLAPHHPQGVVTDLRATLERTAKNLKILDRRAQNKYGYPLLKTIGISAPGAWLKEGIPYKGTVPNLPDLENYRLAEELSQMMGSGWSAVVNNDGVAHVLALTHLLLTHLEKFPAVKDALKKTRKIAGFIPGTGFGAGAFKVKNGKIIPIPGPQQFFDIILGQGEGRIIHHALTPEDLATGEGLKCQAGRNEILAKKFGKKILSGEFIAALTEHPEERIKEAARALYRKAGKALAQTMILTSQGQIKGESRKAVVNDPPQLEAQFWKGVKGTRIFILGGWLTSRPARNYTLPVLEKELQDKRCDFMIILADDIPGVRELLKNDSAGLFGAALLCAPSQASLPQAKKEKC